MRVHPHSNFKATIRCHAHHRLIKARHNRHPPGRKHRGAVRRLLGVRGQANTNQTPIGLALLLARAHRFDIDHLKRTPDTGRIITAIKMFICHIHIRHLLGLHKIFKTNLPRLATHLKRKCIQREFHGKAHAGASHAAVGYKTRLVCSDTLRDAAVTIKGIRTGQITDRLTWFNPNRKGPD